MSVSMRHKVPETCRYWRMNKCIKGKHQCNYVHGFICVNDGRCWRENCSNWHFRQKRGGRGDHYGKSYQKMHRNRYPRSRSRSSSPRWHHKQGHRMRSPPRRRSRSRSPQSWRSRSRSRSRSRRSRSRSPNSRRSRSRSPGPRRSRSRSYHSRKSRSYSFPSRRSKSRTPTSHRSKSRSPSSRRKNSQERSRSNSQRRTASPSKSRQRSRSHSPYERRSRSRSRRNSRSPEQRSRSASPSQRKSRSQSPPHQRSGSFNSCERRSRSQSPVWQRNRSGTSLSHLDNDKYKTREEERDGVDLNQTSGTGRTESSSPSKNTPGMQRIRSGFQEQMSRQEGSISGAIHSEDVMSASSGSEKAPTDKPSIIELQERIARDLMDPHTQNLLKEILKQSKTTKSDKDSPKKEISPDPATVANELEELGMDLEEVGEEVDDIFGKSLARSVEDSIGSAFQQGLERGKRLRQVQASTNPSPPPCTRASHSSPSRGQDAGYPMEWNLKNVEESGKKVEESSKSGPDAKGWVPAFDWHKAQKASKDAKYQSGPTDWEVETPYVQRKDKTEERAVAKPAPKESKQGMSCGMPSLSSSRVPPPPSMVSQHQEEVLASRLPELNKDTQRPALFPSGSHAYQTSIPSVLQAQQTRAHTSKATLPSPVEEVINEPEVPKQSRSKSKRHKEKAKQRKNYDSDSDSSTGEKKRKEKEAKEVDSAQKLMLKRETLLKRGRSLTEQKELMMSQREDIINNHKGDKHSLSNLLEENWFLVKEMGNQVAKINQMVLQVEDEIEILRPGTQFQTRAESPPKSRRSPAAMRMSGGSRQIEHTKTPEQMYKHSQNSYRNEAKSYDYSGQQRSLSPGEHKSRSPVSGNHRSRSPAPANHRSHSPMPANHRSHSPAMGSHRSRSPAMGSHRSRSPAMGSHRSRSPAMGSHRSRSPAMGSHRSHSPAIGNIRSHSPLPGKRRSRSPGPGAHRGSSPVGRQQRSSRSPNMSRHRSRTPNASQHRIRSPTSGQRSYSPSGEYTRESQRGHSASRRRLVSTKADSEKRQPDIYRKKEELKEEIEDSLHLPQSFTQRTYIRYCDQGMHWCKLCSIFCESIPEYVDHLVSQSHLAKTKYDRKTWLAKATKEEKEPKPPNATALIVPVQGVEFLHSLTSYYCSLCDIFMRDKGEAVRHPESKIHTANYKEHLTKNPMYEASLLKTKAAAYAKYSVEQARYMVEAKMKLKEKIATDEIEEKLLRQIKQKREMGRLEKEENMDHSEKTEKEKPEKKQESKKEKSERREREKKQGESDFTKSQDAKRESHARQPSESKEYKDTSTKSESKRERSSTKDRDKDKDKDKERDKDKESTTKDLKAETDESAYSDAKDGQDGDKKSGSQKLPLIGKMPFLKKKQSGGGSRRKESRDVKQEMASTSNPLYDPKFDTPIADDEKKPEMPLPETVQWALQQETEMATENVSDPNTYTETEYHLGIEESGYPPMNEYGNYEDQSCEVVNQGDEYNCVDEFNSSECMDIDEDEESTECAAAATLKALDLLSIPLPGFKSANKSPVPCDIPLPPKMDELSRNQDNCDLPLPPGEESYPVTHFEMDKDSQGIAATAHHDLMRDGESGSNSQDSFPTSILMSSSQGGSDVPIPPGTESMVSSDMAIPTRHDMPDLPLPPGTECMTDVPVPPGTEQVMEPSLPLPPGTEHVMDPNLHLPPGTEGMGMPCLPPPPGMEAPMMTQPPPPPGTEEVALSNLPLPPGTEEESDIPLPPGTEYETHMMTSSGTGTPSTKSKSLHSQDIIHKSKMAGDIAMPGTHYNAQELSSGAWSSGSSSQDGFGMQGYMAGMHENPIPPPPGTEDEHVMAAMGSHAVVSQYGAENVMQATSSMPVGMSSYSTSKSSLHTQAWSASDGMEHAAWSADPSTMPVMVDMPVVGRKPVDRESTPPPPGTEMDDLKSEGHPELGEASMELSDESDVEIQHDRTELTPPPPGTEIGSESTEPTFAAHELPFALDSIKKPQLVSATASLPQSKATERNRSMQNVLEFSDPVNNDKTFTSDIGVSRHIVPESQKEKERFQEKNVQDPEPIVFKKSPRSGRFAEQEREEIDRDTKRGSETKSKQRKSSKKAKDSIEEDEGTETIIEESNELLEASSTKSPSKRSSRSAKSVKLEEEQDTGEDTSDSQKKLYRKSKSKVESEDPRTEEVSQEDSQTKRRTGRGSKKEKDESDQGSPAKEVRPRKRSSRSSSEEQSVEKGSSSSRRKGRSSRATIPEENEDDFDYDSPSLKSSAKFESPDKLNSSDVEEDQDSDTEVVSHQRTRGVRRILSEEPTNETPSPRKRSRKARTSTCEEEEPPPRRSTRTTRSSITE